MKPYFLFLFLALPVFSFANPTPSEIYLDLQKFYSLKKVLYLAAHPDDENTRVLAWFSLGEKARTAYLSLTRGDGGQNLIGNELSEDLGVLRTQELLSARSYDKAEQYFSRAVDFGYSKSAEETLLKWGKETILADVVLMIRKFQPDVIISRFPPDERAGHGHHTASALLAIDAFEKAADPEYLPEQVKEFGTWKTTSIYWNASNGWNKDVDKEAIGNPDYLVRDVGGYSSVLGKSFNEIGTIARSQHKCQGFGAILERGSRIEYFKYLAGVRLKNDFFEANTLNWNEIVDGEFEKQLNRLLDHFDFVNVESNVESLLALRRKLDGLPESAFKHRKIARLNRIVLDCLGVHAEVSGKDYAVTSGESASFDLGIISRSAIPVVLKNVNGRSLHTELLINKPITETFAIVNNRDISNPYWLRSDFTNVFTVDDKEDLLKAENDSPFSCTITLEISGTDIITTLPVEYVWRDPSFGERRRAAICVPDFSVSFGEKSLIMRPGQTRTIELSVHSFKENLVDAIVLEVPDTWKISREKIPLQIRNKHEDYLITVDITASDESKRGYLVLRDSKGNMLHSYGEIAYDHIATQAVFKKSRLECISIDARIREGSIAYIKGVEDDVPQAIRQLGFDVSVFDVKDLAQLDLSNFQTIVLGIRIYNVHEELKNYEARLFDYVKEGGNLVIQYNTASRENTGQKFGGPLPFELSRNRVTEEDAAVSFLQPEHTIMNYPNKLSQADFDNWAQERGLYFAVNWDEGYTPLLSWHDEGEDPQLGALIVANYGRGQIVYTGISFFRELPNGVEGAYRLFANLLSYE